MVVDLARGAREAARAAVGGEDGVCDPGALALVDLETITEARSRLNTVYMTGCFIGASAGSFLGGLAWDHFQWPGVCAVGLAFGAVAYLANRFYGKANTAV